MHLRSVIFTGFLALCICLPAPASAGQAAKQVPGYFRITVGDAVVTALYDGYFRLGTRAYRDIKPDTLQKLLQAQFEKNPKSVSVAVNAYVVDTGKTRVMIDGGTADCFGPDMGRLPENLQAAGIPPESISAVLLTHMHGDHVCGLNNGAQPLFPNAEIWASEEEITWWLKDGDGAAPDTWRSFTDTARKAMAPYRNGHLHAFKNGQKFFGVFTAMATPGHTPGHTAFRLSSKGETLVFAGDLFHGVAVQFAQPETTVLSDCDPALAVATRLHFLQSAADGEWLVAGSHLPFPGIGHIRREGTHFAYVPVKYRPLP